MDFRLRVDFPYGVHHDGEGCLLCTVVRRQLVDLVDEDLVSKDQLPHQELVLREVRVRGRHVAEVPPRCLLLSILISIVASTRALDLGRELLRIYQTDAAVQLDLAK